MRRLIFILLFIINTATVFAFQVDTTQVEETILLFVRHAERAEDGTRNPPISEEGVIRAKNLAHVLLSKGFKPSAIYSTPYKRTQMTAKPTAELNNLDLIEYGFDDLDNWLTTLIESNRGKVILVVGHSNTTPRLINMVMGEERFEQLDEHAYGDLFILRTNSYGSGAIEISSF